MHHLLSLDTIQEDQVVPLKESNKSKKSKKRYYPRVAGAGSVDSLAMSAGGGSGSAFTAVPLAAGSEEAPDAVRTARGAQGRAGVGTQDRDEGRGRSGADSARG
jgi:hypothetical protein